MERADHSAPNLRLPGALVFLGVFLAEVLIFALVHTSSPHPTW